MPQRARGSIRRFLTALAVVVALPASPAAAAECGRPEADCEVPGGTYRLALPPETGPAPAVVFLHGWGGSAAGVMRNDGMLRTLAARGHALIAPQGLARPSHPNADWGVQDGQAHPRDDVAFLAAVIDDAAGHGVDRERVLLAGFSRGSSMVWDLACRAPRTARAYAPVAGAFWQPMPQDCAGPVDLFHTHGWRDRTVPLEGRPVADGTLRQGDVWASLALLRQANGCTSGRPDEMPIDHDIWTRRWDCPQGRIDLMLHPGRHGLPSGWLDRALDWFEALEK